MLCDAQQSQLLIVDIQEKLANALPKACVTELVRCTQLLTTAAKLLEVPILHSEQYPQGLGKTLAPIAQSISSHSSAIEKTSFSCANVPGIIEQLNHNDREQVILVGIETHICILQTALDLFELGFDVFVIEDAVYSRNEPMRNNALARLRQAGIIVTNSESVVFEWLRDAKHPHFKALAPLLR